MSLIKAPSCLLIWIWFPFLNQNYVPETHFLLLIWIISLIEAPLFPLIWIYVPNLNNYHTYKLALDFCLETKLYPWNYSISIVRIKSSRALRPRPMFLNILYVRYYTEPKKRLPNINAPVTKCEIIRTPVWSIW